MNKGYPHVNKNSLCSEAGINYISTIINNDFKWIFRRNPLEYDFGIDGYIDLVSDDGAVTGQSFAVQVKTGNSYFEEKTPTGYFYRGDSKHFNYYSNLKHPVILIQCTENCSQVIWELFDPLKTEGTGTNWKINIPNRNKFDKSSKRLLESIIGKPNDILKNVEKEWELNKKIEKSEIIHFAISRKEIELKKFKNIESFFLRLQVNESLCRMVQGKVLITVSGYINDKRELWEIDEVITWFKEVEFKIKHWFYFLNMKDYSHGIKTLVSCQCCSSNPVNDKQVDAKGIITLNLNHKKLHDFIKRNLLSLDEIAEKLNLSTEESCRIKKEVLTVLQIKDYE